LGSALIDVMVRGVRGSRSVRMFAGKGSMYVALGSSVIEKLGLYETPYTVEVTLADGRRVTAKLYLAGVEVMGRRGLVLVAEPDTSTPLLGVYALETLGFKADSETGEFEGVSPEGGRILFPAVEL